jgi:tetratricopeptide (TPR) repeat protein
LQLLFNKDINGDWKRQNYYKPTKEELIRSALYEWVNDKNFNSIVGNSYGRYDFKNVFDVCPIPTLICEGKWDLTWMDYKANILRRNHSNAQFVYFENSGHSIYSDEPKLFFSTLKKFATSLKPISQDGINNWQTQSNKILKPQETLFENEALFFSLIENMGLEDAFIYYENFKLKNKDENLFTESGMNGLAYSYLNNKEYETAIRLFKMNIATFPNSWNAYDSLGEAYFKSGNKEKAIENYEKSLKLNPENGNGKKILKDIKS